MAFPTLAATNTSAETAADVTNHTVALPSGILVGHLLLVIFVTDSTPAVTWPGGWTVIAARSSAGACRLEVAVRQADGTEGASITVQTASAQRSGHISHRYIAAELIATDPPDSEVTSGGAASNPDPPLHAAAGGTRDYVWIAISANDDGTSTVSTWPAGYTANQLQAGGHADGVNAAAATRNFRAGSENPGNFTLTTNKIWAAATVAIYERIGNEVILPLLTNTATLLAPRVNTALTVPALTVTATLLAPNVQGAVTVPALTVTATLLAPNVQGVVTVPALTNTATLLAPQLDAVLDVPLLTNTATLLAPNLQDVVTVPALTVTATLLAPNVQGAVTVPRRTVDIILLSPTVTTPTNAVSPPTLVLVPALLAPDVVAGGGVEQPTRAVLGGSATRALLEPSRSDATVAPSGTRAVLSSSKRGTG